MSTQVYRSTQVAPGCSITRRRSRGVPTLTEQQIQRLADILYEKLSQGKDTDNILFKGYIFNFSVKTEEEYKEKKTGVEFMGKKETYFQKEIHVQNLQLEGLYTLEGNTVKHNIPVLKILFHLKGKNPIIFNR